MAKGTSRVKTTRTAVQPERAPFVGYVNITLTSDDKDDYEAWSNESDVVEEQYLSALELGYQFSIKYDLASEAFLCSASQFRIGRPDAGLIYSARSNHPFAALHKAVYVVSRKLAFNLANGYVSRPNRDAF